MTNDESIDELRQRTRDSLQALRGNASSDDLQRAKDIVLRLRNARDYDLMGQLAEAVSRIDPKDARNRRLYAQYLIETEKVTAAIDLLLALTRRLPHDNPEYNEATGLLGRCHKQIFFDAADKTSEHAREALKKAIDAYRKPYQDDPTLTWQGTNLLALLTRARFVGSRIAPNLEPEAIAQQLLSVLQATPEESRDEWYLPTLAEVSLGLQEWAEIDRYVAKYVATSDAKAFQVASTLRQFTQVWDLENRGPSGRALVDMLRARLMRLEGAETRLSPQALQRVRALSVPDDGRLEVVLGASRAQTYRWWKTGVDRAASVAAVRQRMGSRVGTGFLVRAGDLGMQPEDESLLMTNWHVVNESGSYPGIRPDDAEVVFEVVDSETVYTVEGKPLWSSSKDRHDVSLLRLNPSPSGIPPLPIATSLPVVDESARVYIIGHPGGRDLAFSFQDNELLDHEGPPGGQPVFPGVCRVHYRAPTEGGSSGSPVFNSRLWQVIALHHMGGKEGMPKLNGKGGTYGANEGISIQSIRAAIASS